MRNNHYKDEDHESYAINIGSFNISGILGRPRIIEVGNEYLQTTGLKKCLSEDDGCMDIEVKDYKTLATDGTEV